MADNQPAQNPAADLASTQNPSQQPATATADTPAASTPTINLDSFSDDEKKYLESQGVKDLTNVDDIKKVINHARTSQKTAAEIKAEFDKVKNVVVPPQETPANPLVETPASQPQDGQPTTPQPQMLDEVSAFNLAASLATAYPDIKDDFTSGDFYKNMQAMGIPMHTADGKINFAGMQGFADFAVKQKKMEAAQQPNPDSVPDANPTTPQQPDENFEMDKQKALAILAQDPNHKRAEEARQFLQKSV